MTVLAYVFWHRPAPGADPAAYERALLAFHARLAEGGVPGGVSSHSLRVPDLAWLPGGGYEDWYLVRDFTALGALNDAAVDAARRPAHDEVARQVAGGAGGVYRLVDGTDRVREGWVRWLSKPAGTGYADVLAEWAPAAGGALWQRQMVLGPAPEFRLVEPHRHGSGTGHALDLVDAR